MVYSTGMAIHYETVKVDTATKERLRYVAAIEDRSQTVVLDEALREYIERHADQFRAGIDHMTSVLRNDDHRAAAILTGMTEAKLARLEGR